MVSKGWMRRTASLTRFTKIAGNRVPDGRRMQQFFKNALRIKVNAITCDLSRAAKGPR
jgi:hypothetical protein